jgi:hypothetical protein
VTRNDFDHWLFQMDTRLERLAELLPEHVHTRLDYSTKSLDILEAWLMDAYENHTQILAVPERERLDCIATYVGETIRKIIGGKWNIDLQNKKNAYYRIPVIENGTFGSEAPVALITASLDRRTGNYISGVLTALSK